ncbi:leucine-rich repeat domain-containing protein [bacterium]|nr:leucine-rich repeat domain-containing protein [bacterium]
MCAIKKNFNEIISTSDFSSFSFPSNVEKNIVLFFLYNKRKISRCIEIARNLIRAADEGYDDTLFLNQLSLRSLPLEIKNLVFLSTLGLYGNQIKSLPLEIALLTGLRTLYLEENKLTDLPLNIELVKNLRELQLGCNKISNLSSTIGELKKTCYFRIKQ